MIIRNAATLAAGGLALGLFSAAAQAQVPAASNKCKTKNLPQIVNPAGGTGVIFDEDCTTAFVLPPETGRAHVAQLARNANLQFCPAVLQAGNTANSLMASISSVADQINQLIKDYEPLRQQIVAAGEVLVDKTVAADRARAELQLEEQKLTTLQGEVLTAKSSYDTCQVLTPGQCAGAEQTWNQKKLAYVQQNDVVTQKRLVKLGADSELSQAQAEKQNLESRYANATAPLTPLLAQLTTLNSTAFSLYENWAPLEGATGQIVYTVDWSTLTNAYASANPGTIQKGVTFRPVPISEGQFYATMKLPNADGSKLPGIPALLSAVVPGAQPAGPNHLSGGLVKIMPSVTDASAPRPDVGGTLTGYGQFSGTAGVQGVSGQIVLSLAGACPYFPQGTASPDKSTINSDELTAHMVANAMLAYDVKQRRKYSATFHLANLVTRMESMKEEGGFFSSKNVHDLVQTADHHEWFDITFDVDGGDFQWTPEEQTKLTQEVKADLIDRALVNVATAAGSPPPLPGVPSETGAGATSKRLMMCPNLYCWAGGFILGTLDSIFGSKEAVSNFKSQNNAWVSDNVNQVKMTRRRTIITFQAL